MNTTSLYHPEGYPEIGLTGGALQLAAKPRSSRRVRDALVQHERSHGSPRFRALRVGRVPVELAAEIARVYVSMRTMYPLVRVDRIDFAGERNRHGAETIASMIAYPWTAPTLMRTARRTTVRRPVALADAAQRLGVAPQRAAYEAWVLGEWRPEADLTCHGSIEYHDKFFTSARAYQELVDNPGWRADVPGLVVSRASDATIHEFGHIVDSVVQAQSYEACEHVYRALSCVLGGFERPRTWRDHLINYPERLRGGIRGHRSLGNTQTMRARWDERLLAQVGPNALRMRSELFADSFLLAHGGNRTTRRKLSPLRRALKDVGLTVA